MLLQIESVDIKKLIIKLRKFRDVNHFKQGQGFEKFIISKLFGISAILKGIDQILIGALELSKHSFYQNLDKLIVTMSPSMTLRSILAI